MSKSTSIAKANRLSNAGGCYPDAHSYATTLAILLIKLAKLGMRSRPAITMVALFIWLTEDWTKIKKASDIPDFRRVTCDADCTENTFRTYYDGTVSWAEYARPCRYKNHVIYLWQPIPTYLNPFFQQFISNYNSYGKPFLSYKAKESLFELMTTSWKTPRALALFPRVNKSELQQYFNRSAKADNTLGAIVRIQLIEPNQAHHASAMYYQRLNSDYIRYRIFEAHNRYLSRLIQAARNNKLNSFFEVYLKSFFFFFINESIKKARYLSQSSAISQFRIEYIRDKDGNDVTTSTHITPSISVGSVRSLEDNDVSYFFTKLHTLTLVAKQNASVKRATKAALRDYYNKATYRIALLFIVLTGARPTHAISILSIYYSQTDVVFIKDKGCLRQLILSDYLQQEIKQYLLLKMAIRSQLSIHIELDELWYTCNEANTPVRLSSSSLRLFMHQLWPDVVPYQLRHFFCYCANSHMFSDKLFDNDIDRLMGHENLGERLGSDMLSPKRFSALKTYLNTLPQRLGLEALTHV